MIFFFISCSLISFLGAERSLSVVRGAESGHGAPASPGAVAVLGRVETRDARLVLCRRGAESVGSGGGGAVEAAGPHPSLGGLHCSAR